jgi:hypothetical protein
MSVSRSLVSALMFAPSACSFAQSSRARVQSDSHAQYDPVRQHDPRVGVTV